MVKLTKRNKILLGIFVPLITIAIVLGTVLPLALKNTKNPENRYTKLNIKSIVTHANSDASSADRSQKGGCIFVEPNSVCNLADTTISGFSKKFGGAIYVSENAVVNLDNVQIVSNMAKYGGAIYAEKGAQIYFNSGSVKGNISEIGEAIFIEEDVNIYIERDNVEIQDNLNGNFNAEIDSVILNIIDVDSRDSSLVIHMCSGSLTLDQAYKSLLDIYEETGTNLEFDYENYNGLFLDEQLTMSVEAHGYQNLKQTLPNGKFVLNLYTKRATLDYLSFARSNDELKCYVGLSSTYSGGDIVLPATHNGLPVEFYDGTSLASGETVPEDFAHNQNISSVWIPSNLRIIAGDVFYECSISSINMTDYVDEIGNSAFYGCQNLVDINFYGTRIGIGAFCYNENLKNVNFGERLEYIGDEAFVHCDAIEKLVFPKTLTFIGMYAFRSKLNLKSVYFGVSNEDIPNSLEIQEMAFADCDILEKFFVPARLKQCEKNILENSTQILTCYYQTDSGAVAQGYFSEAQSVIDDDSSKFLDFTIANNQLITYSGNNEIVVIPEGVVKINNGSFIGEGRSNIKKIIFPNSLQVIEQGVFVSCQNLQTIVFGNNLLEIGAECFADCQKLENVSLPSGLQYIGMDAFHECYRLKNIFIPKSVQYIGGGAFTNCGAYWMQDHQAWDTSASLKNFIICFESENHDLASNLDNYENIYYEQPRGSEKGFIMEGKKLIKYIGDEKHVLIPDFVETIGTNCFDGCTNVETIYVGKTVTTICKEAFFGCENLVYVYFSNKLASIQGLIFDKYSNVFEIFLPSNVKLPGCPLSETDLAVDTSLDYEKDKTWAILIPNYGWSLAESFFHWQNTSGYLGFATE